VKSKEEIAKTLTPDGRNKGLWFDREMLPSAAECIESVSELSGSSTSATVS